MALDRVRGRYVLCEHVECCGGPNANAKILIHLADPTFQVSCSAAQAQPLCTEIKTNGRLYPSPGHWAFLLVTDGDGPAGVASVEMGLDYESGTNSGVHLISWTLCGNAETTVGGPNGAWPAPGSGNRITWSVPAQCQQFEPGGPGTGVVAAAGYFYVAAYTQDILGLVLNPNSGIAAVGSCSAEIDTVQGPDIVRTPSHLGNVRFSASGTEPGYNPYGLNTPVENTSWGQIKGMYR